MVSGFVRKIGFFFKFELKGGMYFSGKVTNSIFSFLEQSVGDFNEVYDLTDLPAGFLRDPSHWLAADQVEKFLNRVQGAYGVSLSVDDLCEVVGHQSHTLHSWGVLDSVLRMMMSPRDIFTQPQRFISYFISPAPPVGNLQFDRNQVYFELPISHGEYPQFCSYLKAALESLPQFMKRSMAHVEWTENELRVNWEDNQQKLMDMGEKQLKPEFVQNLLLTIESTERELEEKNYALQTRQSEIKKLRSQLEESPRNQVNVVAELEKLMDPPLKNIHSQFMRLSDYLARAQQLVTLLVGQGRQDKQVKEAMKRVNWDQIRSRFTNVVQDGLNHIEGIRHQIREVEMVSKHKESRLPVRLNLDSLVERAIARAVSNFKKKDVQVDRMLFFDREIVGYPEELEGALVEVLDCSSQTLDKQGHIRVITRPKGPRAEIEISDNGVGLSQQKLQSMDSQGMVKHVIDRHGGGIRISSQEKQGSTFLIDLPS